MIDQRFINKKKANKQVKEGKEGRDTEDQEEKKKRGKPLDQNSPNIELGVFGVNNIKKREKTVTDSRPVKQN